MNENEIKLSEQTDSFKQKFIDAMDDDLNTADAIAAIFDIVYAANTQFSSEGSNAVEAVKKVLNTIHELGDVLGLFNKEKEAVLDSEIEALIEERNEARKAKDWAKADEIRDKLKAMNIILKDTPMGVKWSRTDV